MSHKIAELPVSDGTTADAPEAHLDTTDSNSNSDHRDYDLEKKGHDGNEKVFVANAEDDEARVAEVEELEERIRLGIATKEEYECKDSHDVAVKVLSTADDPTLPVLTFRMFFLGLGFSAFGSVLAQIYYFKPQTLSVSQGFLIILTYFFGKGLALMPSRGWFRFLNPGPFNIKEHCAIIIMASTAAGSASGIQVISVQELYYDNEMNGGIAIFTLLGSQLLGYGFAGLLQEALVYPTICLWPNNITPAAMFQALHADGGLSNFRVKLFWILFTAIFVWEIIPQYVFPLLTGVSIACLVNHTSPIVRNVFGGASNNEGMGFLSWCFDWNLIGSACLYTPLWTQLNQNIGICFTYILMPAVYYGNLWNGRNLPFMSQAIFLANGTQYPQNEILTNNEFDREKYEAIGQPYFASTNALYFIVENLALGACIVHVGLFYWEEVKPFFLALNPWNKHVHIVHDEHFTKMQIYKKVPRWWFLSILLIAYAIAQATNYTGKSQLPWWALTVLVIISFFLTCAYATMAAILGFYQFNTSGLGFFQMLTAYFVPGKPIANMYGGLYGATPLNQSIALLQDLKLGQYIKIPPRVTFLVQILGTIVGAVLNYVMMLSIISAQRPALLSVSGTRLWSGQNAQSYNSNGIAWGALAAEMFSAGKTYYMVPAALGIGLVLPLPFYFMHRWKPHQGWNNLNTAIMMQYSCYLSVGVNTSVNPSMAIGVFSQWFVRKRWPALFTNYNYIVSGALDGGTQVISFILNFAVFGAAGTAYNMPYWWGNSEVYSVDRCLLPDS